MSKWLSSKSLQITNVGEDRNKRESCYTVVGIINWFKHWKTVWRFCRKLKIQLLYHQTIPLLGIYPKNLQTINAGEGVEKREPSYTVSGNAN